MTASKILVVDDESSIRTLVRSYLAAEEYAVVEAENGEEAVQLVQEQTPDLVVLDVSMPVLDGIEALRQIRTFSDVYVVMLTARGDASWDPQVARMNVFSGIFCTLLGLLALYFGISIIR